MNHEFFLDPFHIQYAVFYKLVFIAFSKLISVSSASQTETRCSFAQIPTLWFRNKSWHSGIASEQSGIPSSCTAISPMDSVPAPDLTFVCK